jgi:hypothetical protein
MRKPMGGVIHEDSGIDVSKLKKAGLDNTAIQNILKANQANDVTLVKQEEKDPFVTIKGLPSGGKFYKNNMGLQMTLKGMPLKVEDALILETMNASEDESLLTQIFERRIRGVNPNDLLLGDEKYLLAWLREQTFIRNPLKVNFICENCQHLNEDIVVTSSDFITYIIPENVKEPYMVPISTGEEIPLRFMRRKDKTRISNYILENDSYRKTTKSDIRKYEIASVMQGVSITDAIEYINDMNIIDFTKLHTAYKKMNFGFTETVVTKCEKEECGYSNIVPVPFQSGYFLPEIGANDS